MIKKEWHALLRQHKNYSWCTDDQWECCLMIFDLVGGKHHLCGKIKAWADGIQYNSQSNHLATFDFNTLTTMVFMAHDRMIRVEINPSGPGMLRWCMWKRHSREGEIYQRHPTLKQALEIYRKSYPERLAVGDDLHPMIKERLEETNA